MAKTGVSRREFFKLGGVGLVGAALLRVTGCGSSSDDTSETQLQTLLVLGERTPESVDHEYPPTEEGHEARRNIEERLLAYASKTNEDGIRIEDFSRLRGALAESWEVSSDGRTITFHLRKGVKSYAGNELTSRDLMWTFDRGWDMKATYYWYLTQILGVKSSDAWSAPDKYTFKLTLPEPSPLIDIIWVNNDLGINDATEAEKHATDEDPWASRWLTTNSASFGPYQIVKWSPGQEVIYEANENYYRGAPKIKRVIYREVPSSSNRVALLQSGDADVSEWLLPRELVSVEDAPNVKVWSVYGNYIHRVEMQNELEPFDNAKVRQALNHLVPRREILENVYYGFGRPTNSPISEIYPAYTEKYFDFPMEEDVEKAKDLLSEAGYPDGFETTLSYRTGSPIEEDLAVILRTSFAKAGVDVTLQKMPASNLVEKYTKGELPMYFFRDMAIVPDAAYVANLWLNSASPINYSRYKNPEVDRLINNALQSTDEKSREADMKKVQQIVIQEPPWVLLVNPGYQLAASDKVRGYSWYTPNGNAWYNFYKIENRES